MLLIVPFALSTVVVVVVVVADSSDDEILDDDDDDDDVDASTIDVVNFFRCSSAVAPMVVVLTLGLESGRYLL